MRPVLFVATALTALAALSLLRPTPLTLASTSLAAVASALLPVSGTAAAGLYVIASALLALSPAAVYTPLLEAAAFLTLYDRRINELAERLHMRGYERPQVVEATAKAELVVASWVGVALSISYAVYFALAALPRLPPSVALALAVISLVLILIMLLEYGGSDEGRRS
ncbi:MAG: hypothetical protein ABWJ97_06875 [Thermoproteus sp.]